MKEYFEKNIQYLVRQSIAGTGISSVPLIHDCDLSQYPEKLYRFRTFKKFDLESLRDEYLWITEPEFFVDPEDARINIGADENPKIAKENDVALNEAFVDRFLLSFDRSDLLHNYSKEMIMESVRSFPGEDYSFDEMITYLKQELNNHSVAPEMLNKLESLLQPLKELEESIPEKRSAIINSFRKNFRVCCLTEKYDNRKMWEDYSDNYSGFVIEYSRPQTVVPSHPFMNLFPVEYYEKMPIVDLAPLTTEIIKNNLREENAVVTENLVQMFKQMLSKRAEYASEKEWRLVHDKSVDNKYPFPYVSAVYAGYKIKPNNLSKLKKICKQKGIILYRQTYSEYTATLSYEEVSMDR